MGTTIFMSPWVDDPDYIVNLTKHVVGERVLTSLTAIGSGARNPRSLVLVLTPRIAIELSKMNSETLGRICAYGTEHGFHDGPPRVAPFLNLTGYQDVMANGAYLALRSSSGRAHLEQLALWSIICVARDIVMQSEWQANIARELESNENYSKGVEDYIHGRKR